MLTFEELAQNAPKLTYLPKELEDSRFSTSFWEDLYQLFKARMIAESKLESPHE